jgi:hypothetical protein
LVATKIVLVVSTNTSMVLGQGSQAAGHSGHTKTPPTSEATQWHTPLELLFAILAGWAQSPSQILLRSYTQYPCMLQQSHNPPSHLEVATSKSNKHTGLQHEHLVPLYEISPSNALDLHSLAIDSQSHKNKWVRELPSQALPWETHPQGAQQPPSPGNPSIYRGRKKTSHYTLFSSSNGSLGLSLIHSRAVLHSKN